MWLNFNRLLLALHFKRFFWWMCYRLYTLVVGFNTTRICPFRARIFLCEINSIFTTWICCVLTLFRTYRNRVWPNPTSTSPRYNRLRFGSRRFRFFDWSNFYNDVVMFLEISHLQICQCMLLDFVCDCLALTFHELLVPEIKLSIMDFIK